jgi:site-specific DNA-adenine methylase
MAELKAPFTYFGGKARTAVEVWRRFSYDVPNYIEAFFGGGSNLLNRPGWHKGTTWFEIVNDYDGYLTNFWRSIKYDPVDTAKHASWPVLESQLHAVHSWLVSQKESMRAKLEGNPEWYDTKAAGWWVWGTSCWIGITFCEGKGAWGIDEDEDGDQILVKKKGGTVYRKRINVASLGVNKLGKITQEDYLEKWFKSLSDRLLTVKVVCGDWTRVTTDFMTTKKDNKITAVFLDPPYSKEADRNNTLYAEDSLTVAHDVREWCKANGNNKKLRIALCGYDGEHNELEDMGWDRYEWKASGGYGNQGTKGKGRENKSREVIWFSPHCLKMKQIILA